jgi:hypothetical protein
MYNDNIEKAVEYWNDFGRSLSGLLTTKRYAKAI